MIKMANQFIKPIFKRCLKIVVFLLVLFMIMQTIERSYFEFEQASLSLGALSIGPILLSAVLYCLGLSCFAYMWHRVLCILKQNPTHKDSLGSYFLSQLGKYVPGKALVVLIRSERVQSTRTALSPAIIGVFIETLAMMAVGAVLGGLMIICFGDDTSDKKLFWISGLLAVVAGVPSTPPFFRAVIGFLSRKRLGDSWSEYVANVCLATMFPCWCIAIIGWLFLGGSMVACLHAIPTDVFITPYSKGDYPIVTASVALAMVAGFVSLIPGGAGVREYIILTLLAGPYGVVAATVVAVLLRLIWLVSELALASVFYILMKRQSL